MMTEKQYIKSQKDCADMLGMSLSEYEKFCEEKSTCYKFNNNREYDNEILKVLGLTPDDLLKKNAVNIN